MIYIKKLLSLDVILNFLYFCLFQITSIVLCVKVCLEKYIWFIKFTLYFLFENETENLTGVKMFETKFPCHSDETLFQWLSKGLYHRHNGQVAWNSYKGSIVETYVLNQESASEWSGNSVIMHVTVLHGSWRFWFIRSRVQHVIYSHISWFKSHQLT